MACGAFSAQGMSWAISWVVEADSSFSVDFGVILYELQVTVLILFPPIGGTSVQCRVTWQPEMTG